MESEQKTKFIKGHLVGFRFVKLQVEFIKQIAEKGINWTVQNCQNNVLTTNRNYREWGRGRGNFFFFTFQFLKL